MQKWLSLIDSGRIFHHASVLLLRLLATLGCGLGALALLGGLVRALGREDEGPKFSAIVAVVVALAGLVVIARQLWLRSVRLAAADRPKLLDLLLDLSRYLGEAAAVATAAVGVAVGLAQVFSGLAGSYVAYRVLSDDSAYFVEHTLMASDASVLLRLTGFGVILAGLLLGYLVLHTSYLGAELGELCLRFLRRRPERPAETSSSVPGPLPPASLPSPGDRTIQA